MPRRNTPLTESPPPVSSHEVRALRQRLRVSQSTMAKLLNVSVELVQAWEADRRVPRGAALRLIDLIRSRPHLVFDAPSAPTAPRSEPPGIERRARDRRRDGATGASGATGTPAMGAVRESRRTPQSPSRLGAARPPAAAGSAPSVGSPGTDGLLRGLVAHGIAFVAVGGVAAQLRGAPGRTDDLDIVYDRAPANLERMATFLKGLQTTLRGAPGTIPFAADPRTLAHTAVLALDTKLGPLDLRQRIAGIGDFAASLSNASTVSFAGREIPTLTLDALIVSKRATGRSKDREEVRALEALR